MYLLKHKPEDFVVVEKPLLRLGEGRYLYFRLIKKNWNTIDIVQRLARMLQIKEKEIGFAGSKDKQAITEQYISLLGVSRKEVERVHIPEAELHFAGYGDVPVSLGDLEGNSFVIIVRNLELAAPATSEKIDFIPNYFDEQRFGSNNAVIGKCLIQKRFAEAAGLISDAKVESHLEKHPQDFVGALKKLPLRLLRLYVNAYQSWLWNELAAEVIRKRWKSVKEVRYSQGIFVFPLEAAVDDFSRAIPLPGFNGAAIIGDKDIEDKELQILIEERMKAEGIAYTDFVIKQIPELTLGGEARAVFVPVHNFYLGEVLDDEYFPGKKKVQLSFSLGKGSYATMVVRRIFLSV